ncbi:ScbR family autoregulator-binding transcription factor [Kribbella sp. NPDC051620]|uniref:ScbR family autoregulator-binding transcription factor n=1 Tax=Kribbella sp. NPDC051620 TaxID=3364120 RepID=UPI0037B2F751
MAQQERAIRTRQVLLLAAASVFDEVGYDAASISEILSRSAMTKGALYFHFASKEELARGVIEAQTVDLELPETGSKLQDLVCLTQLIASRLQTDVLLRAGIRLTVEERTLNLLGTSRVSPYARWIEICEALLTAAKANGELLGHVRPPAVAELVVASFTGIQLVSQVYSRRVDLPERLSTFWRYLLPGIAVPGVLPHVATELPIAG